MRSSWLSFVVEWSNWLSFVVERSNWLLYTVAVIVRFSYIGKDSLIAKERKNE